MSEPRLKRRWIASVGMVTASVLLASGCTKKPAATAAKPAAAPVAAAPAPKPPTREELAIAQFHQVVEPILRARCYECHGDGAKKGGVAFDELTPERLARDPQLWLKVLKNTRSQIMPPPEEENPLRDTERVALENWIKISAFGLDPTVADPGRVTIHRLNRTEYTNTIRDLLGVTYNAEGEFPGDDSGYGFENVADVLNMSPLLMEKYLTAAQAVVNQAVPKVSRVTAVQMVGPAEFRDAEGKPLPSGRGGRGGGGGGGPGGGGAQISMPYIKEALVTSTFKVKEAGEYRVIVEQNYRGDFNE